jgi:hypothetical protein
MFHVFFRLCHFLSGTEYRIKRQGCIIEPTAFVDGVSGTRQHSFNTEDIRTRKGVNNVEFEVLSGCQPYQNTELVIDIPEVSLHTETADLLRRPQKYNRCEGFRSTVIYVTRFSYEVTESLLM